MIIYILPINITLQTALPYMLASIRKAINSHHINSNAIFQ